MYSYGRAFNRIVPLSEQGCIIPKCFDGLASAEFDSSSLIAELISKQVPQVPPIIAELILLSYACHLNEGDRTVA